MNTLPLPAMALEAAQSAEAARRQISRCEAAFAELGERLHQRPPRLRSVVRRMVELGAEVLEVPGTEPLPVVPGGPSAIAPLSQRLAVARGQDPDVPAHLREVTETV